MIQFEKIIHYGIEDDVVRSVLLYLDTTERFFEGADTIEMMMREACRCSAHEITIDEAIVSGSGKHSIFEVVM
jgi:hypothetical protein